ncbi:MAG: aminotransferase class I/II-fold pyridoxal phosphate-dependent enzyme [Treponema sp.]|jgi:aspartate/methionine/tyrosine aminotransferase|nr:aminotransferase class I/II-fold pyridoxal phosphate-dependent enzyme [Treponema sp.]
MNPLAEELNAVLDETVAGRMLSDPGRRLFFPRGIISQSAEAKKTARINATIGMAYEKNRPLILSAIAGRLPDLRPEESVMYAPTAGLEELRAAWKKDMVLKNPSLKGKKFSLPVVVPGITAGISYAADLFLNQNQTILAGDPRWDNYDLIFHERLNGTVKPVSFFPATGKAGGLDLSALKKALREEAKTGSIRLILNFPHNPSGYTPSKAEADSIAALIREAAEGGADVLVLCDDAYFGLFYEEGTIRESLFGIFSELHERVLAVKIDGPTKEDYVWGFRIAFLSFASAGLSENHYEALVKKLMGVIRSSVSCSNTAAQYLTLKAMNDVNTKKEKEHCYKLLQSRYRAVRRFVAENHSPPGLEVLPFNSGYFMTFRCTRFSAEKLRRKLLEKGIGTIALGDLYLRVTFAAVDEGEIPDLYGTIYQTAAEIS